MLEEFETLHPYLSGGQDMPRYGEIAAKLKKQEGAIKMAVQRLRRRYSELSRAAVADTLRNPTPQEIEEEIRYLRKILRE